MGNAFLSYSWYEYDGGDYFVEEDWMGCGMLGISVLKWKALKKQLIKECYIFIQEKYPQYIINIQKALPEKDNMFNIIINASEAYFGIYDKAEKYARNSLLNKPEYSGIRDYFCHRL